MNKLIGKLDDWLIVNWGRSVLLLMMELLGHANSEVGPGKGFNVIRSLFLLLLALWMVTRCV